MKTAEQWYSEGLTRAELSYSADRVSEYLRDLEDALEAVTQALAVDPVHPGALRWRCLIESRLDRPEGVVEAFEAAVSVQAADVELLLAVAGAFGKLKRLELALGAFEDALRLSPADPLALLGRAETLTAMGRDALALAAWDSALAVLVTRTFSHAGFVPGPIITVTEDSRASEARRARAVVVSRLGRG